MTKRRRDKDPRHHRHQAGRHQMLLRGAREPRIKSLAHARGAALRIVPTASDPMASSSTGLRLPVGRRTETARHLSFAVQFEETHTVYLGNLGKVGVDTG